MIEWVIGIILGLFALLGTLLGIQTFRVKKNKQKVTELKEEVVEKERQNSIYKTTRSHSDEAKQEVENVTQEYEKLEEELDEAKTTDDIIRVANDIVDKFMSND
jgi:predicted nuclease with TOPRIM domain